MKWIWFKCTPALESGALLTITWGLRSLCHFSCSYFLGCFLTPNFHSMTLIFLACKFALVGPLNLSSNLFYLILLRIKPKTSDVLGRDPITVPHLSPLNFPLESFNDSCNIWSSVPTVAMTEPVVANTCTLGVSSHTQNHCLS